MNRSQRCGVCAGCQAKPCGLCIYCQDSPQFGGPGVKKQSCLERRCLRVLENRLQRDAPTFKAKAGCMRCDDCQTMDCFVCLVCLDKKFFQNRYLPGAMCAKKRCTNARPIDVPVHFVDTQLHIMAMAAGAPFPQSAMISYMPPHVLHPHYRPVNGVFASVFSEQRPPPGSITAAAHSNTLPPQQRMAPTVNCQAQLMQQRTAATAASAHTPQTKRVADEVNIDNAKQRRLQNATFGPSFSQSYAQPTLIRHPAHVASEQTSPSTSKLDSLTPNSGSSGSSNEHYQMHSSTFAVTTANSNPFANWSPYCDSDYEVDSLLDAHSDEAQDAAPQRHYYAAHTTHNVILQQL